MAAREAHVQWKGTDACLDFTCGACGAHGHVDGYFAYALRCTSCGAVWCTPNSLPMAPAAPDDPWPAQAVDVEVDRGA